MTNEYVFFTPSFARAGAKAYTPANNLAVPFRQAIRRQGQGIGYPRPQHLVDNHQPCRLRIQLYDLPVQPL